MRTDPAQVSGVALEDATHKRLAQALRFLHQMEWVSCVEDAIYFLEKPWKWQAEYELWVAAGEPGPSEPGWELLEHRLNVS